MANVADIPGLNALWADTQGEGVYVGMIEGGPINASHLCFRGADLHVAETLWLPPPTEAHEILKEHGTFTASVMWGQPQNGLRGLAPACRGLFIPAFVDADSIVDPMNLAHAVNHAVDQGVDVLYIGVAVPTLSGATDKLLRSAVERAAHQGVMLVACAGNLHGEYPCNPAIIEQVLAVGAVDDQGAVCDFSNFGPQFADHGIVAPGKDILGAHHSGGLVRRTGTSVAGPIVAGVGALLLALSRSRGRHSSPTDIRDALLRSATPCSPAETGGQPGRCLSGRLNVVDAVDLATRTAPPERPLGRPVLPRSVTGNVRPAFDGPVLSALPKARQPIYALGELGYDFGTEARRDTFKQLMAPQEIDGTVLPPNPYDARQMVEHLSSNPSEARSLIWTLNLELTPIYALKAGGSFAAEIYGVLTRLLTGAVAAESDLNYIERVAIPGVLSGSSVKLFSGQVVPVVELEQVRGLYGWEVNRLVDAAVGAAEDAAQARGGGSADVETITENLREFLTKIYYDLRNLGTMSRDRALNFAATNAFQAAQTFASALSRGMAVDTINVEKSPFCRLDSDCWDVQLRFFDPENSRRARRIFRFTIDVSDTMPVTLGEVRTWTAPR
jgi:hypothetical protein